MSELNGYRKTDRFIINQDGDLLEVYENEGELVQYGNMLGRFNRAFNGKDLIEWFSMLPPPFDWKIVSEESIFKNLRKYKIAWRNLEKLNEHK